MKINKKIIFIIFSLPAHWDQPTKIPRHSSVLSRQPSALSRQPPIWEMYLFILRSSVTTKILFVFVKQNEIVGLNKMRVVCRASTSRLEYNKNHYERSAISHFNYINNFPKKRIYIYTLSWFCRCGYKKRSKIFFNT